MRTLLLALLFFINITYADNLVNEKAKKNLEKVSLQLHWKYQFQFAGFIAAKEKGFYRDVGLDVELKEYNFGMNIIDAVVSGKSTYGIYNSNILISYLQNSSIKLISSYFKRSALVLITSPDIISAKDLIGKSIMAGTRADFDLNFKSLFKNQNIDIDSLNLIKHTYNIDDFVLGKVDAMTAFISDQPYKLDKEGVSYNIINPSDFGTFNLQLELFTSNTEVLEHPQRVKNFKEASTRGWNYALSHKDEIIKLIYDKYSKGISIDSLKNESEEIDKLILPKTYDIGSIDKNFLHRQFEMFKTIYNVGDDIVLNNFIHAADKNNINLSKKEMDFLNLSKSVKVCIHPNLYPIDGYQNLKQVGIMGDIYREISLKTGIEFIAIPTSDYKDLRNKIANKECEIASILPINNTHSNMKTTKPFISSYFSLISNLDKSFVQNPIELKGKKLLVELKEYKQLLLNSYPYLSIEVQNSKNKMIKTLLNNDVFAIVAINESSDYLIDKYGYGKLKTNGFLLKEDSIKAGIGIQKDEVILGSIIQKTLDSIPPSKIESIAKDWRLIRHTKIIDYSLVWKILIVVSIVLSIMIYYQRKLKNTNKKLALTIEELIQKDEILTIQSKQAVMGEMISMIAHQWRQPLSTITLQISNLQIKKMLGKEIDDDYHDKTLEEISNSIIYLSETIDDFQTYFHPDKITVKIEIHELIQKVITFATPRVKSNKISINMYENENIFIKTYANELIQVLINILNNAIDALESVKRDNKFVNLYVKSSNNRVLIYIEDNASGISDENLKKLFEPYFSTKGKNGTGLGLYMSHMIIQKQFDGDIRVQTSSDGTIFIVEIPINIVKRQ